MPYKHITQKEARAAVKQIDDLKFAVARAGTRLDNTRLTRDEALKTRTALLLGHRIVLRQGNEWDLFDIIAVKM